ncbi:hypothetical protein ACFVT2_30045 [Streptomyces sp. NPDC058000]|uniref:hypothetical protein n=1 Tax=Streptomyces sp. NPDC058000 TaxID=3346299 RepID=UPI0036E40438
MRLSQERLVGVQAISTLLASAHRHALRGQQHQLRVPPCHHRAGALADDPQQPPALGIIDLTSPYSLCHAHSLTGQYRTGDHQGNASL